MSGISPQEGTERRILALGPGNKDAVLIASVLAEAGMHCHFCTTSTELRRELEIGVGALVVTEEAVLDGARATLTEFVRNQPQWSELPVLILTTPGSRSPGIAHVMEVLGNVTLLERPMRIAALVSALRAALRARQRQYQIRAYIAERARIEESLRETDRRKDEFLAALAHELRNPLAPISNILHLLRHEGSRDQEAKWAHAVIDRQVRCLTRLVDDLLDVSRITRGKVNLRRENVDLATVINNAVETSRPLLDSARHEFVLSLPAEPVRLNADPVRLAQAFANLLNNAAKYTPDRGRIELSAVREDGHAVVRVKDTGIGIDPVMLPRVFELFVQADHGLDRSQGGLGIGLTLVRTFVQLHGGSVAARSDGPGSGSEFIVRLPALDASDRPNGGSASLTRDKGGARGKRILIVDDNVDGAQSLAVLLQMQGNEVHVVFDGPQAVAAIPTFAPDVVLLDIGLPTLNGYDTAREIRARPEGGCVLIIALTGWGQEEHRRRSRDAGFDHHLVKPVDLQTLEHLLGTGTMHWID